MRVPELFSTFSSATTSTSLDKDEIDQENMAKLVK